MLFFKRICRKNFSNNLDRFARCFLSADDVYCDGVFAHITVDLDREVCVVSELEVLTAVNECSVLTDRCIGNNKAVVSSYCDFHVSIHSRHVNCGRNLANAAAETVNDLALAEY